MRAANQETGEQGLVETLLERIRLLEAQLVSTKQQLERLRQNSDKEKLAHLTRLVEVTSERDNLRASMLEKEKPTNSEGINPQTPSSPTATSSIPATSSSATSNAPNTFTLPVNSASPTQPKATTSLSLYPRFVGPLVPYSVFSPIPAPTEPQIRTSFFRGDTSRPPAGTAGIPARQQPHSSSQSARKRIAPRNYFNSDIDNSFISVEDEVDSDDERHRPSKKPKVEPYMKRFTTVSTSSTVPPRPVHNTTAIRSTARAAPQNPSPYKDWEGKPWNRGFNPFSPTTKRDGVPLGITAVRSGLADMTNDPFGAAEDKARCSNCQLIGHFAKHCPSALGLAPAINGTANRNGWFRKGPTGGIWVKKQNARWDERQKKIVW